MHKKRVPLKMQIFSDVRKRLFHRAALLVEGVLVT